MNDRLEQIIKGITAAGGGSFQMTLIDEGSDAGNWAVAVVFGREAEDSPMVGGVSMMMAPTANDAIQHILDETRWADIP